MPEKNNIVTQLRQWLRGDARRSDEAKLDRTAQSDDFLRDALEGYRTFPAADHASRSEALRKRIRERTARDRNVRILPWLRVAAGIFVLLLAVGGFYYLNQPATPTLAEQRTEDNRRETVDRDSLDRVDEEMQRRRDRERETADAETVETQDQAAPQKDMVSPPENSTPEEQQTADGEQEILDREPPPVETQDLAAPQKDLESQANRDEPLSPPAPALAETRELAIRSAPIEMNMVAVRRGRIVDTAGQPVPGVELRTPGRQEIIALSDAQGIVTLDTTMQRLIVERTGFQPVQWPVEESATPYLQLQPAEEAAPASYSLKSRARSLPAAAPAAYPSVGYDSLRQWLQERTTASRRMLRFSFTLHQDGRLTNVVPADPDNAAYVDEIFSLLQQGPVWVLPPGVDSVRVDFQF